MRRFDFRPPQTDNRIFWWGMSLLLALVILAVYGVLSSSLFRADAAPAGAAVIPKAARPATLDQTIQIKLRDLLGLVPNDGTREQVGQILARLKAIEEQLNAIEQILRAGPGPTPLPPVPGAPIGPLRSPR